MSELSAIGVTLRVEVQPDEGEDGTSYYRGKTKMDGAYDSVSMF